ncbi:MAG: hypothetical protein KTQ49_02000 [Candidatus Omnitrophica bacterium]|nr:hypothetical protein [Candidatus Omnitrophota bacterium]
MKIKILLMLFVAIQLTGSVPLLAQEAEAVAAAAPNLFVDHFYASPSVRQSRGITDVRGFSFLKTPSRKQNAEYSVVTDFGEGVVKSRYLPGLKDPEAIDEYIKANLKTAQYEGVEIRQLPLTDASGSMTDLYWVGDKGYKNPGEAMAAIGAVKAAVVSRGGDFAQDVRDAPLYVPPVEEEVPVEIKTPAQYKKEEELVLKFTDQLDIGEKLWGPFHGRPSGEPLLWQSFGETSWRLTNLSDRDYKSQVGYWTNRLVFKGIRFPLNTIDPFVENTISMDSTSNPGSNNLMLWAGLEWYPMMRNAWLQNFRPFGGIPILDWIRNYRFYIKYGDRKNIKNEIENSEDYDLVWGVQIFYEWGTELPPLEEGPPQKFTDYLRQYVWGEYYGDYSVQKTNFGSEESYNAFLANTSLIMGIILPGIPVPENPINNEFVLMPYVRFESTMNSKFSFWYQNYYFIAPGLRWMPFRNYRWKENEWLSKFAIFGEWVGIGRNQYLKQDGDPSTKVSYDLRFGAKFSHRRF